MARIHIFAIRKSLMYSQLISQGNPALMDKNNSKQNMKNQKRQMFLIKIRYPCFYVEVTSLSIEFVNNGLHFN